MSTTMRLPINFPADYTRESRTSGRSGANIGTSTVMRRLRLKTWVGLAICACGVLVLCGLI